MSLTGKGLCEFAKSMIGTPYVYGMKGQVMTLEKFNELQKRYGKSYVWDSDKKKVGQVCVDCSGLISMYTGKMYGSSQLYEVASLRKPISDIANAPVGAVLWRKGHVGVYAGIQSGMCMCYEAKGSAYGTVASLVSNTTFTYYLLFDFIKYDTVNVYSTEAVLKQAVIDIRGKGTRPDKSWESVSTMQLKNVPALIEFLGGLEFLVRNGIINNTQLWREKRYKQNHVSDLLVKYAKFKKSTSR